MSKRNAKKILVLHDPIGSEDSLPGTLFPRSEELDAVYREHLDGARAHFREQHFDAVLFPRGLKRLGLESFRKLAAGRATLMVIDDDVPGYHRIEGSSAARIVDQVFGIMGIARSQIFDRKVLEQLGFNGPVSVEQIEFEGIDEPVICSRLRAENTLPDEIPAAQRIAQLQGPGLASTLEVFWDDPRPHVLQAVPRGISLSRLFERTTSSPRRFLRDAFGLAIMRSLLPAIDTLHGASLSIGRVEAASIWLTTSGEVLLLGRGLSHLSWHHVHSNSTPPSETVLSGHHLAPSIGGDAFRLGALLIDASGGDSPFWAVPRDEFVSLAWRPENMARLDALEGARALTVALCAPTREGPSGPELRALIERHVPSDGAALIAEVVNATLATPRRRW